MHALVSRLSVLAKPRATDDVTERQPVEHGASRPLDASLSRPFTQARRDPSKRISEAPLSAGSLASKNHSGSRHCALGLVESHKAVKVLVLTPEFLVQIS